MDYTGVGLVDKPKVIKIFQAVYSSDQTALSAVLRNADQSLRTSMALVLSNNKFPGSSAALKAIATSNDPLIAVRAAAVCLLVVNSVR